MTYGNRNSIEGFIKNTPAHSRNVYVARFKIFGSRVFNGKSTKQVIEGSHGGKNRQNAYSPFDASQYGKARR